MQGFAGHDTALQAKAGRLRNQVDTLSDFSSRYDPMAAADDAVFVEALAEATEDLGIHKEDIAARLGTSPASIYRWLNRKNLPQQILIPVIMKELAQLARAKADDLVDAFAQGREARSGLWSFRGSLFEDGLPVVETKAEGIHVSPIGTDAFEGQAGASRATFAAFDWRGRPGEGAVLAPAMAVAEAHLLVCTPGLEIFDHRQKKFVEVILGEGGIADVVIFAADPAAPIIPEIRVRARSGSGGKQVAWGRLILCCEFGVPVSLSGRTASFHEARTMDEEAIARAEMFETRFAQGPDWKQGFGQLLSEGVGREEYMTYEHCLALKNGNFEIWHDRALYSLQWSRRQRDRELKSTLMNRYVVFDRENARPIEDVTYLATHSGREILIPLRGLVAAYMVDRRDVQRTISNEQRFEFGLSELRELGAECTPLFVGTGRLDRDRDGIGRGQLVQIDPFKTIHGFTAVSRSAVILHISVKDVGSSEGWRALSRPEPVSRLSSAA